MNAFISFVFVFKKNSCSHWLGKLSLISYCKKTKAKNVVIPKYSFPILFGVFFSRCAAFHNTFCIRIFYSPCLANYNMQILLAGVMTEKPTNSEKFGINRPFSSTLKHFLSTIIKSVKWLSSSFVGIHINLDYMMNGDMFFNQDIISETVIISWKIANIN